MNSTTPPAPANPAIPAARFTAAAIAFAIGVATVAAPAPQAAPGVTPPESTPPASTPPASTPPESTPPASTPPESTPPESTPPATSRPAVAKEDLPAAKKILERTVKAMGGKAALEKIKSGHTMAKLTSPMAQMEIETHWLRPDKMLIKQVITGMGEIEVGHDGTVGWMTNPMTGAYDLLSPEQIEQMKGQATIHVTLANVEKEFEKVETVDLTEFDGRACYKLHVVADPNLQTPPGVEPDETFLYVDKKTNLFAGMESTGQTEMGRMSMSITFHDWKEIDGVKFFRKMNATQMGMAMEIDYSMIELNTVDPGMFEPPDEVKKLAEAQGKRGATSRPATPTTTPADPDPAPGGGG